MEDQNEDDGRAIAHSCDVCGGPSQKPSWSVSPTFNMSTKSAVLLVIFNRPVLTNKVFARVRDARPARLYVAADGPRHDRIDDMRLTQETRAISGLVDWPCRVHLLFRDVNLGCRLAVSSAINWFFQNESEGIILEDDCLPAPSFFRFCDELLERYRFDDRIAQISGSNFIGDGHAAKASYFFSHYPDVWGWATWRRSWDNNDIDMKQWPLFRLAPLAGLVGGGRMANAYWRRNFDLTWSGEIDTWDYQWMFSVWRRGGINIFPASNQIENLGFGEGATHTFHPPPGFLKCARELQFPIVHPREVKVNTVTDRVISKVRYQISASGSVLRYARSIGFVRDLSGKLKEARRNVSQ